MIDSSNEQEHATKLTIEVLKDRIIIMQDTIVLLEKCLSKGLGNITMEQSEYLEVCLDFLDKSYQNGLDVKDRLGEP